MWVFFSLFMEDTMLQDAFMKVYTKFKLHFYAKFFERIQERETSLTTVETFCMEIIYSINNPTVNEFAKVANISSPNAAYKVNNLIKKGYLRKVQSEVDKREFHLEVTDKYMDYYNMSSGYIDDVMERLEQHLTPEELQTVEKALQIMSEELMPEIEVGNSR
jgi:DNA-binding MarR family transcriptional regulator